MRRWMLVLLLSMTVGPLVAKTPTAAHAAARTWTVCNAGCSFTPDFSAIQPAISAASNGDTIDVYGSPTAYTGGLGIGISITLEGVGTGTVTISGGGPVITVGQSGAASLPTVTIRNLTITGGNTTASSGGGGILNYGILTVTNSAITLNKASHGGGIAQYGSASGMASSLTVSNSTISLNHTDISGGGIADFAASVAGYASTVTVVNSAISGNSASNEGGGISEYSSGLSVTDTTIAGNTASYNGAGIANDYGTLSLTNSTISANHTLKQGGGIFNYAGSMSLGNTIVAQNLADASDPDCSGAFADAPGHNFIGAGSSGCSGLVNGYSGDQVGTVATPLDAQLDPSGLQSNGGPTQTISLLPGSPALKTGDGATCRSSSVNNQDQRGMTRPNSCSIGAYDAGTWSVNSGTGSDPSGSSCPVSATYRTLIAVILCAGNSDTVVLAAGTYGGGISIQRYITLAGSGAATTTITGGATVISVFYVNVQLRSVTVTGGKGNGGIANVGGQVTVSNSTVSGNNTGSGAGGGIYNTNGGTLIVAGSTISNNSAGSGGGIYNDFAATVSVTGSTISTNTASSNGGGIYNIGTLTVTNSTISTNSSAAGGGIYNYIMATVTGSIVTDNSGTYGGGIYDEPSSTLNLTNSTISNNHSGGGNGGGIDNTGTLTIDNSTIGPNNKACFGAGIFNLGGTVTVTQSTVIGNVSCRDGGGIQINTGSLTVTGSTITGNQAPGVGGGINNGGSLTIVNSTFTANTAVLGGGIRGGGAITNSTISQNTATSGGGGIYIPSSVPGTLTNTILAGNSSTAGGPDCDGVAPELADGAGHNLLGNNANCSGLTSASDQIGTAGSPIDPRLGALAGNGGPTQAMALLPGSPAIDAGDDATCVTLPVNGVDQRGTTRPFSAHCDIGALESVGIPVSITSGWNLLVLPVHDPSLTSMSGLITALNNQLGAGSVSVGAIYANGRFSLYVPTYSADVPLQATSGIFIRSSKTGTWNGLRTISGSTFYTSGQPVTLHPGWNLVAAPFPYQGLRSSTIAGQIDPACAGGPCSVKEIAIYSGGRYLTYVPGGIDRSVPSTAGIWIEMSTATTWTPR